MFFIFFHKNVAWTLFCQKWEVSSMLLPIIIAILICITSEELAICVPPSRLRCLLSAVVLCYDGFILLFSTKAAYTLLCQKWEVFQCYCNDLYICIKNTITIFLLDKETYLPQQKWEVFIITTKFPKPAQENITWYD